MDIDGFLRFHRTSRDEVHDRLLAAVCRGADDVLILAGSLAEGVGNHRSDLDVYRLPACEEPSEPGSDPVEIVDLGTVVADVETVGPERLGRLCACLGAVASDDPRDPRQSVADFTDADVKLLHQLCIATAFHGEERFRQIRAAVDRRKLARVLLDRAVAWMNVLQVDILGFIEVGDEASARTLLRAFRMRLGAALLAGLGETNPAEKWQTRRLLACASERPTLCLPGGLDLVAAVDAWSTFDRQIGELPVGQAFAGLLGLRSAIVPWGQCRFLSGIPLEGEANGFPRFEGSVGAAGERLPSLRLDCQVQQDERGIWISRIADPRMLYLNPLAHELLMHFDGASTSARAHARLEQISRAESDEIARSIADLRAVLEDNALL